MLKSKDFVLSSYELFQWSLSYGNCRVTQDPCVLLSDLSTHINSIDALVELLWRIDSEKLSQGKPGDLCSCHIRILFSHQVGVCSSLLCIKFDKF